MHDMDGIVSAEGLAIRDHIVAQLQGVSDDDVPFVAAQLLRMAQDLLGPELWSITIEGLFMMNVQDILDRHRRQDQQAQA